MTLIGTSSTTIRIGGAAPWIGAVRPSVHIATLAMPVHHLPERRVTVIRTRAAHHGPRYAKVNSPDTSTSAP